jgi:DNA-binding CsgD family transcriptional regulator
VLDELVADVRGSTGRALVLRGDAGIGKTALLEYLVEKASGMTLVRALGVESEMELAFAGLQQVCAPLLDRLHELPGPQKDALEIAFGLSAGPAPDRFLIGLAVLSLLSEAGEERPVLCVVDDAQWLDHASALTLAFVARRLLAEPVGVVFASREPGDDLQQISELEVRGLRDKDARALLGSAMRFGLDERVRDRIIAETRGNPLALLELPNGMTAAQLAEGLGLADLTPLSREIEASYVRQLASFSDPERLFLLVAAADPVGDPLLLWRASERLGITSPVDQGPPVRDLITISERVTFRHPLVRSAIYRSADLERRRSVHVALAEATDAQTDPDRRAWHLAAAAAGPDEQVALELERSAGRAQARGGLAAAAAFRARAVALTPEPAQRPGRALAAAQAKYEAGLLNDAVALLTTAREGVVDGPQRIWTDLLRAQIAFASRRGSDAPPLLLKAARELEALDPSMARAVYLEAISAALFAGRLARDVGAKEVSEAALATLPPNRDADGPSDLLLRGLAIRFTGGYPAAAPILKEALSSFRASALTPQDARWLWLAGGIAWELWDDESWTVLLTRHLELVRATGALSSVAFGLSVRSAVHAFSGELTAASALIDEIQAVAATMGVEAAPHAAVWLGAVRGREEDLNELIRATREDATDREEGFLFGVIEHARAVLYNGLGRYEEALEAARHAGERAYEMDSSTTLVELVEAAARSGQHELAEQALARLTETTRASGTDWALGTEARSRALLSEGEVAETLYGESIERLERTRIGVGAARAHLLYGEWLRRENRRIDARGQLRVAHERFTAMGVEAFAERARVELAATGEKVRKRSPETRDELTGQERQVAHLARDGLSNSEIAARLFLSHRTVEWHLGKVFAKLGIRSRSQLAKALPASQSDLVAA